MTAARFLKLLGCFVLLSSTAGCIPYVVWLPDSSGFVCTSSRTGELLHFDVGTKTQRSLGSATASNTLCPAMSPDGRRFAVARREGKKDEFATLKVMVFDRDGKPLHESEAIDWEYTIDDDILMLPRLFWGVDDKVLVWSGNTTAIYDVKTEGVTKLAATQPLVCRNTPIRPDGKGFLARRWHSLLFVDWDGKERQIETKPSFWDVVATPETALLFSSPECHSSWWENDRAILCWHNVRVEIDTRGMKAAAYTAEPGQTADRQVIQQQYFFDGGARLRVVELMKRQQGEDKMEWGTFRVELVKSLDRQPQVLASESPLGVMLSPSPDRKLLAVTCSGKDHPVIVVLNPQGEIVSTFTPDGN